MDSAISVKNAQLQMFMKLTPGMAKVRSVGHTWPAELFEWPAKVLDVLKIKQAQPKSKHVAKLSLVLLEMLFGFFGHL